MYVRAAKTITMHVFPLFDIGLNVEYTYKINESAVSFESTVIFFSKYVIYVNDI